ncbi:MAG: DUF5110 domain-containing protein, partial [Actinobacteria bacterium]|nr:DUF5110 domain-containing protein [Actinomycetota bacterium]
LFVKGGSIIPMWPEGTLSWMTRDPGQLDLDVYPDGHGSFTLYEDDGVTRRYADGEYSHQTFTVEATGRGARLTIGAVQGSYPGQPASRRYLVQAHHPHGVTEVTTPSIPITEATTLTLG